MAMPINSALFNYTLARSSTFDGWFDHTGIGLLFREQAYEAVDAIWRAQPWTPVTIIRDHDQFMPDNGPWNYVDNSSETDNNWTAATWYQGTTLASPSNPPPIDVDHRTIQRRLSVFGFAYYLHHRYIRQLNNQAYAAAFDFDDAGEIFRHDLIFDDPHGLPRPVYSILTRANLLLPEMAPTPLFK